LVGEGVVVALSGASLSFILKFWLLSCEREEI